MRAGLAMFSAVSWMRVISAPHSTNAVAGNRGIAEVDGTGRVAEDDAGLDVTGSPL
jgi:hypothetical protein